MARPACLLDRFNRLMFVLFMVIAWTGWARVGALADAPAPATRPDDLSPQEYLRRADQIERGIKAGSEALGKIPREHFDPAAVLQRIGAEPDALTAFVRDQTAWIPYLGALRGAVGVLMDRRGNSLDRSLLLADLLHRAGQSVRLAHAKLKPEQAQPLVYAFLNPPAAPVPAPQPAAAQGGSAALSPAQQILDDAVSAARKYGIDETRTRQFAARQQFRGERLYQDMIERVTDQTPLLQNAIDAAKVRKADAAPSPAADALAAACDHWWVQRQNGNDWVDLDVTLPALHGGNAPTAPAETFAPDKLPADVWHTVVVRVVAESWDGKKLGEAALLEQPLRCADVCDKNVVLRSIPLDWPDDFTIVAGDDVAKKVKQAAIAQHRWMPVLKVGADQITQHAIEGDGTFIDKPQTLAIERGGKTSQSKMTGASGALEGDTPALAAAAHKGFLTAQWIEYDIRSPGHAAKTYRRQIFDLIGAGARNAAPPQLAELTNHQKLQRSLALLGETQIVVAGSEVSPEFVEYQALASALNGASVMPKVYRSLANPVPGKPVDWAKVSGEVGSGLSPAWMLAVTRLRLNPGRQSIYLDRPNVLTHHVFLGADPQDRFTGGTAFDIVANPVAVYPSAKADAFQVRMQQGIADTNAESLLQQSSGKIDNAADRLTADDSIQIVRTADDPALASLSSEAHARVAADLAAGYAIALPKQVQAATTSDGSCWWRIDLSSGETLGIGVNGWGVSLVEYAKMLVIMFSVVFTLCVGLSAALTGGATNEQLILCAMVAALAASAYAFGFVNGASGPPAPPTGGAAVGGGVGGATALGSTLPP